MIRKITGISLLATAILGLLPLACQPGGVGDPCTPEDEYTQSFPGYSAGEVTAEARSFQCETRLCLVDHFQGRVSCKYGQDAPAKGATDTNCKVPGGSNLPITAQVNPQRVDRTADKAVYCSCRCDGQDKNARYCKCPSGFSCQHAIDDIGVGDAQLAGSYCIRDNTGYDPTKTESCSPVGGKNGTCGSADPG